MNNPNHHKIRNKIFALRWFCRSAPAAAWQQPDQITELFDSCKLVTDAGTVLPLEKARTAHDIPRGAPHKRGKVVLSVNA
jgi:hypothetical protein